jgi:DNA-binding PadR family transcriptional regulator
VSGERLGRFGETAVWILVALREGPRNVARLLDDVRALDGRVGPGTLFGAVARLERLALIEPTTNGDAGRRAYRLTGQAAATAASGEGGAS